MIKKYCLFLLSFCFSLQANAQLPAAKRDSLLTILKIKKQGLRERQLIFYLRNYMGDMPESSLKNAKVETDQLLQSYHVANRAGINYFIETACQMRLMHYREAERSLIKAIEQANKNDDDYLLYACFTHLGFIQTYQGNTIEGISSFRMAKKEAAILNDAYMQVVIDINISDIYYKINLYSQSIFYIDQAQSLMVAHHINEPKIKNAIINNKAEIYFRMNNADSLKKYNQILKDTKAGTYRLYSYKKRTNYYVDMLQHNYPKAISAMQVLRNDSLYHFDGTDKQNLADAYFMAGQLDSAKAIINSLLADEAQHNHPEVKLHLYEVLGQIAQVHQNDGQAAFNYKMALQQTKEQIGRLTSVDTISSQIKLDEMQGSYIQKVESYKREQLWLIFTIIITVMGLVIGGLFYRGIKREKYYEKLLFAAKKEELAYINSHEVRRHLSNILGIIDTIKQSEDRHQGYLQAEDHLLSAAGNLDAAIKSISSKLDN